MSRGALIGIVVGSLAIAIPCVTLVVLGWIFLFVAGKTVNGLLVKVARQDEIVKHPFWQTPPTSAELQALATLMTTPGVQTVAIDDRGHTAAFNASSVRKLPADFSQRFVWVRCNHHWDQPRAFGALKAELDTFVTAEAAKKAPPGDGE